MIDVAVFDHPGRISADNCIVGNVFDDYGSHGDDSAIPDANIPAYTDIGSEPDEIADFHMLRHIGSAVGDGFPAVVIMRTEHDLAVLARMEVSADLHTTPPHYLKAIAVEIIADGHFGLAGDPAETRNTYVLSGFQALIFEHAAPESASAFPIEPQR